MIRIIIIATTLTLSMFAIYQGNTIHDKLLQIDERLTDIEAIYHVYKD